MGDSEMRSRLGAIGLVCLSIIAVAGIAAAGSDPILACVHKTTGAVRIVSSAEACTSQEASVSWASSSNVGVTYYVVHAEQVFDAPLTSPLPDPLPTEPASGPFGPIPWSYENYQSEYPEFVVSCDSGDIAVSGSVILAGRTTVTTGSGTPITEFDTYYPYTAFIPVVESDLPVGYREIMHPVLQSNWRWDPLSDELTYDRSWVDGYVTCLDLP